MTSNLVAKYKDDPEVNEIRFIDIRACTVCSWL